MVDINNLAVVDFEAPDDNPTAVPTYLAARAITASTAKTITVPSGAAYVRLAGTVDFFVAYTLKTAASATVAIVPTDDDAGGSNEMIKTNGNATWRICSAVSGLSVITAATSGIVTASFYSR